MLKAYEYRIYPTERQKILLAKHFGCARFVFNKALALKIELYEKEGKSISKFEINKLITQWKKEEDMAWLNEVLAQSLQQSVADLDSAFINFFREKQGFPKFKNKKTNRYSYRIPQHVRMDFKNNKIIVPKFLEGIKAKIDRGFDGNIKSATIKKVPSGKYFVSILVENTSSDVSQKDIVPSTTIGIDLGLKKFAVISDGREIDNPKTLKNNLAKLKTLQRRLKKKEKGGSNREKARIKVAKQYEKVNNIRADFLQKLSTQIINDNQINTICLETLNISGLMGNHKLAQSIFDASWGRFVKMLQYKADWNGKNILRIGRFEPSSKLCTCGHINNKLALSDRVWTCPRCAAIHNRDLLAAKNIKRMALSDLNKKYHDSGLGKLVSIAEICM